MSDLVRIKIESQIESLKAQLSGLEEGSQPVAPDVSLGRLTRMEAIQSKAISENALGETLARISLLEKALERIKTGTYGICDICNKPIAQARLEYIPETTLCVNCASA